MSTCSIAEANGLVASWPGEYHLLRRRGNVPVVTRAKAHGIYDARRSLERRTGPTSMGMTIASPAPSNLTAPIRTQRLS